MHLRFSAFCGFRQGGRLILPVNGLKFHRGIVAAIGKQIQPLLDAGQYFHLQFKPWREKRSLAQNALSHMWYTEVSEYLIALGKAFTTPEWVMDAMKHTYLGCESKDRVDVVSGEVTTVQTLRHTSELEAGGMYIFLCKVEACAMSIGCHLTIPQYCEYQQLRDKHEV
ncbi:MULTISPECIES: YbcN family protein [Enterobacter cloacae complex]|jgi:hypothetical protein|uniref:YbcN family protein n=1 Tax=Enterobacter cloacae complex TaxID=354276 RepID=UPI000B42208D|nr:MULTISPECIES: YbcN family protein [Enterobacter cloacae complex]QIN37772.1 hypothetical protein E5283_01790 [Enterobacter ludwigii]RNV98191.1 hypothetical protein CAF89_009325 [Enterobacter asburiae]